MDISKYQEARLIPVTGIKGDQDQERRATSALLAVLVGVPEYAKTLLKLAGAPAGSVQTFIEPEFEFGEKKIRPDGLIRVSRGAKSWTALVEVKTGKNTLAPEQLNQYLDIAKSNKIDSLITISNEVLTLSGEHPTKGIDAKKMKGISVLHLSWVRIITLALVQSEFTKVSDPDQAWILKELIRFLQHDASGANEFEDMGPNWVGVRDAVLEGTILASDKRLPEVIGNFESLTRFAAFKLTARLGVTATEIAPKLAKDDPKKHMATQIASFVQSKSLSGAIRVPGAISDIQITADLRAAKLIYKITVAAPTGMKNLTKVNWLLRQFKEAPATLKIDVMTKHSRSVSNSELFANAKVNPALLTPDSSKDVSAFELSLAVKMGTKRGNGAGSFIESFIDGIEGFYADVVQPLKPWQAKAPKLSDNITDIIPESPDSADESLHA